MSKAKPVQFGRVPYAVVSAGWLRKMRGGDAAVYLVLAAHVNSDLIANVGQRRIAELTGFYAGRVIDAMRRLIAAGLIEVVEAGGGTRAATVRLCVPVEPSASAPTGPSASKRAQRSENAELALGKRRPSARADPERNKMNRVEQKAAACVDFLKSVGMTGDLLCNCSQLEDLTTDQARAVYDQAKRRPNVRNLPGLLGRMLLDGERGGVHTDQDSRLKALLDAGLTEADAKRYAKHKGLETDRLFECVRLGGDDPAEVRRLIRNSRDTSSREAGGRIEDTDLVPSSWSTDTQLTNGSPRKRKPEPNGNAGDRKVGTY